MCSESAISQYQALCSTLCTKQISLDSKFFDKLIQIRKALAAESLVLFCKTHGISPSILGPTAKALEVLSQNKKRHFRSSRQPKRRYGKFFAQPRRELLSPHPCTSTGIRIKRKIHRFKCKLLSYYGKSIRLSCHHTAYFFKYWYIFSSNCRSSRKRSQPFGGGKKLSSNHFSRF